MQFILKKTVYSLSILLGIVSLVFLIFNIKPGDPSAMLVGQQVTQESVDAIKRELNYDLPAGKRFFIYLNQISPVGVVSNNEQSRIYLNPQEYTRLLALGEKQIALKPINLGNSFQTKRPVKSMLTEAMPATFLLAGAAILLALVVGITLGTFSTVNHKKASDNITLVVTTLGMASPSFFMAILISWIGGYLLFSEVQLWVFPFLLTLVFAVVKHWKFSKLGLGSVTVFVTGFLACILLNSISPNHFLLATLSLPGTGLTMTGSLIEVDPFLGEYTQWRNLILPALTLGIRPMAVITQLTRGSLLEVMQQDYIRTARAKGLSEQRVFVVHALRNALNPVVTAASGWFASMLAGAVFVEYVFGWKGLGLVVFTALETEDIPVVMGSVLLFGLIFVLINFVVDLIYVLLDPRVKT
ncbi:MAG: ABC transporter permease [Luteibaculaceae bacterium]